MNLEPSVLFRKGYDEESEFDICSEYFPTVQFRSDVPSNSLVIARYSALPFYKELEHDLAAKESKLINSYEQHRWIASFEYYETVKGFTPETWRQHELVHATHDGPYVVKGCTNSKKHQWGELMFAPNKRKAIEIGCQLMNDGVIGTQDIIYRKYTPLRDFGKNLISGCPFSNEWRFFFFGEQLLSFGFYWTNLDDELKPKDAPSECVDLAKAIAKLVAEHVNFFVLDLAETETGDWILIEINDGQMSGLSHNDPRTLYQSLKQCLES